MTRCVLRSRVTIDSLRSADSHVTCRERRLDLGVRRSQWNIDEARKGGELKDGLIIEQ